MGTTKNLLTDVGFVISLEKFQFEPSQRIKFLGFKIDWEREMVSGTALLPNGLFQILVSKDKQ